jgi:hypothetical protein
MADAITRTINEEVVLFDYKESLTVFPDLYPCRISIVPDIRLLNVYLSLPFKKGSPYVKIINSQLARDLQNGKINKILKKYSMPARIAENTQCEDRKTQLGPANAFLPFTILLLANGISLFVMLFENCLFSRLRNNHCQTENKNMEFKKDIFRIWDILSDESITDSAKWTLVKELVTTDNSDN